MAPAQRTSDVDQKAEADEITHRLTLRRGEQRAARGADSAQRAHLLLTLGTTLLSSACQRAACGFAP